MTTGSDGKQVCSVVGPAAAGAAPAAEGSAAAVRWQAFDITKAMHRQHQGHGSAVVWLTGLSGAGKSTIANLLASALHSQGMHTCVLDGDNLRHGLNSDLGFSLADRAENIRRVAEVAKLMVDVGTVVIVVLVSPLRQERALARAVMGPDEFVEVFVDTPLAVAEARDPKGLYRRARRGELPQFTGIDSPYEVPASPDVRVQTVACEPAQAVGVILQALSARLRAQLGDVPGDGGAG